MAMSDLPINDVPGTVQIDDSGLQVLVHVVPPHDWLTLAQLRQWVAYLVTLADESEPSAEMDELTDVLETAAAMVSSHAPRAVARAILGAGWKLERVSA
jgi:hypothetical protein